MVWRERVSPALGEPERPGLLGRWGEPDVHREALAALAVFQQAAARDAAMLELVEEVAALPVHPGLPVRDGMPSEETSRRGWPSEGGVMTHPGGL